MMFKCGAKKMHAARLSKSRPLAGSAVVRLQARRWLALACVVRVSVNYATYTYTGLRGAITVSIHNCDISSVHSIGVVVVR